MFYITSNFPIYTERHNFAYLRCFSSRRCDVLEVRLTPRFRHCRRRACQGPALLDREAKSKTLGSMVKVQLCWTAKQSRRLCGVWSRSSFAGPRSKVEDFAEYEGLLCFVALYCNYLCRCV